MNIRYFGPFDGHNVKEVIRIMRQLKDIPSIKKTKEESLK